MTTPMMITLTGPSCAGKTYLLETMLNLYPEQFVSLVGYTSRPKREKEVEGREYIFVTQEHLLAEHQAGNLCQIVEFGGNYYGTPTENLTAAFESGKTPVRIVEPTGVGQFTDICRKMGANVFSVFVMQSIEAMNYRWLKRYLKDANEAGDSIDLVTNLYAGRLSKSVTEELGWLDARPYNFYADMDRLKVEMVAYALSRIATGNLPMDQANRIAPYPHDQVA